MLYILISKTRPNLTSADYQKLATLAQDFYDNIPAGLTLHSDFAAIDGSRTFALLETDHIELLEQIQSPFRAYVDMELVAVRSMAGWGKPK
jgi:hypothetical protein